MARVGSRGLFGGLLLAFAVLAIATSGPRAEPGFATGASAAAGADKKSRCATHRAAFRRFRSELTLSCEGGYLLVGSNGLPNHEVMVGITRWIQQVPLPQPYGGSNVFKIPLRPHIAEEPTPTSGQNATAVAVNGVPIFNPTDGTGIYSPEHDPKLTGELDDCGGHAGGADDYHYHYGSPCLLHELGSKGALAGYALDGFPIYGYREPDGSKPRHLDGCNGHSSDGLGYHYHFTKDRPYTLLCYRGTPQLEGQPVTQPIRMPHGPEDVTITAASVTAEGGRIDLSSASGPGSVAWQMTSPSCWLFTFNEPATATELEEHCR